MSGDGRGGRLPTTEELVALMLARGLPLSAFEDFTIGMLLNYSCAYDRLQKRLHGEKVSDPEEQYQKLKAMEPQIEQLYAAGKIKPYKYRSYKQSLEQWEKELEEDG